MVDITDGQVLPAVEQEISTSQTEHDPSLHTGRPHQRATKDLAEVVQEQVPTVLGGLDDLGVDLRADGQPVWPVDPGLTKNVSCAGDSVRIPLHVLSEHDRLVRGALGYALHPGCLAAREP